VIDDPIGSRLRGLPDAMTSGLITPPYEHIERRRGQRRRRGSVLAVVASLAIAGVAVAGISLGSRGSGDTNTVRPAETVTAPPPSPVSGPLTLRDVSFVDDKLNAVLGQRCDQAGHCATVVLRSVDGGQTFSDENVVTGAGTVGPAKIALGTGRSLIAYDPGLYLSEDGGGSWQVLTPTNYTVKDVATRGNTFTALAVSSDGRVDLLQVLSVDLGRAAFTRIAVEGADASARLQEGGDGTAFVLVGSNSPGSSVPAAILVRSPGSGSWAHRMLPDRCAAPSFSAPATAAWWLVCADPPSTAGSRAKAAYVSSDQGGHWTAVAPPPAAGLGATVTGVSGSEAYVSGPDSPLYVTRDGGVSWQQAIPRSAAGFGEPHVFQGMSWVVSGSSLWRLEANGGWRETTLP